MIKVTNMNSATFRKPVVVLLLNMLKNGQHPFMLELHFVE